MSNGPIDPPDQATKKRTLRPRLTMESGESVCVNCLFTTSANSEAASDLGLMPRFPLDLLVSMPPVPTGIGSEHYLQHLRLPSRD